MTSIRYTKTREDLATYAKVCRNLVEAMSDGMILRFVFNNDDTVEGYLHRVQMDAQLSDYGRYWGYIEILGEDRNLHIIDLLDVKYIQCITSEDMIRKYANAGVINIAE